MKTFILNHSGSVDNFQLVDVPKPGLKKGEVIIQVKALSINPVDTRSRADEGLLTWIAGDERPVVLGWDISGIITEKADDVTNFAVGDEVFGLVNFNINPDSNTVGLGKAYAEYVVAPANQLALKPENISYDEAAASTLAALTAWQTLVDVCKVKKGDRVLIHAASGGVGHFAIQIAKYFGAYVIGTSSAANKDFILNLGADEHIDYQSSRFYEVVNDIDIVLDTIAGETLTHSVDVVKNGGQIISIYSPDIPKEIQEKAAERDIKVQFILVKSDGRGMDQIASLLSNGAIKANIDKVFSFEDLPSAHLELEKGRTRGKLIIRVD